MSSIRAEKFGEVLFIDHCELPIGDKKGLVLIILDGATSLLWVSPQNTHGEEETRESVREWMHQHTCVPTAIVGDMAFFTPNFETFWVFHGIKNASSWSEDTMA